MNEHSPSEQKHSSLLLVKDTEQRVVKNKSQGGGVANKKGRIGSALVGSGIKGSQESLRCFSLMSDLSRQEEEKGVGEQSQKLSTSRKPESKSGILGTLTAEYDFDGEEEKDLQFKAGQRIQVLKIREKDWWVGSTEDGRRGLFPINFMKRDDQLKKMTQVRSMRNKSCDCFK